MDPFQTLSETARFLCGAHFHALLPPSIRDVRIYRDSCRNVKSRSYFPKSHVSEDPIRATFWVRLKCVTMFYILTHDCCILILYILSLKCEICFPRFKQNLHFAGRGSYFGDIMLLNVLMLREREREKREGRRERDHEKPVLGKTFSGVMWFFTFYDVFNRLEFTFHDK